MAIALDHTIVPARDRVEAAQFFARIFGLPPGEAVGPFVAVRVNDARTLDFADDVPGFEPHHDAFLVDDAEFDAIFARVRAAGCRSPPGRTPATTGRSAATPATAAACTSPTPTGTSTS